MPHSFTLSPSTYSRMLRASLEKGSPVKTLLDYKTLQHLSTPFQPDSRTISFVLEACKTLNHINTTLTTHATIIKFGFHSNPSLLASLITFYVGNNHILHARQVFDEIPKWGFSIVAANIIIASYLRVGKVEEANKVFRGMLRRDVVSWNSMIKGSVRNGRFKEAISLFRKMMKSGFEPDEFSFASVLTACGRIGALSYGEWIHGLMIQKKVVINFILSSALIYMYAKCGSIELAKNVFDSVHRDDVSVWNAMIMGLASHGLASDVMVVFSRLQDENLLPDAITFVGVLTACSHCGLVEEGQQIFESMKAQYLIEPELEHYGAMIDLLCRSGCLEEAYEMIKTMPMEPDVVIWRSLLSACRNQGKVDLGEVAMQKMNHLGSGDYVMMSNIYSSTRRWGHAEKVWQVMKKKGVRKSRALSWIEMGGIVHQFRAGDHSHLESSAIYRVLNELIKRIKVAGFVPATELVLMDVSEEEKENNLSSHSEKLAAAYGILKTSPGTEIRISKNLKTCNDCHSWMKLVSKILNRVIIMRDRIRFHRFEYGSCSCRDYW